MDAAQRRQGVHRPRWSPMLVVAFSVAFSIAFAGCGSSAGSDGSAPEGTGTTSTSTAVPASARRLTFRPVLGVETLVDGKPCDTSRFPIATDSGTEERWDALLSADGTICYLVGPVEADGRDLTDAKAERQEAWIVSVRARESSVDKLNEAFNACYEARGTCPEQGPEGRGAIAIVLDDRVLSAPAVNGADLADDAFVISGAFDESEARDLASVLGG